MVLGLSLLANVAQFFYFIWVDVKHAEREAEQACLNRALREELMDLVRQGRLL